MSMDEQIQKIASENLPTQAAGVMKKFIEQANTNKILLKAKITAIEVAEKELDRLHKLEAEAKATIERCEGKEKELDELEVAIAARERDADHIAKIQEIQLQSKENECAAHRFALSTVFRNNTIKRTMTKDRSHEEITPPTYEGGCFNQQTLNDHENKTIEETQE